MNDLKKLVDDSGLRQVWIANHMKVDKTLLNHWLAGRREMPVAQVQPFAAALRIPIADVVAAREGRTVGRG